MRNDRPVKKAIASLPIRLKAYSKRFSGVSLILLGAQNKDFGAASQMLQTKVKLRRRRRFSPPLQPKKQNFQ